MSERKRIDDLADLAKAAIEALTEALADGNANHPAGSWLNESYGNQLNHLQGHLFRLVSPKPDDTEDHLTHVVCRSIMAYALREKTMITRIFIGETALEDANAALRKGNIIGYQDLAPEHANCVRVALPLLDDATLQARSVYVAGLDRIYTCNIADDDYLTYGSPLDRQWITAPQS